MQRRSKAEGGLPATHLCPPHCAPFAMPHAGTSGAAAAAVLGELVNEGPVLPPPAEEKPKAPSSCS